MFYGWYIAIAGSLLAGIGPALGFYGFTALVNPMVATFGWSYAQVSLAMSLRGLETGVLDPFLGVAADRWPARRLLFIGVGVSVMGLLALSQTRNLAMYYGGFLVMGVGSALLGLVPVVTVSRWFRRNIGKASGLVFMGTGFGGLVIPAIAGLADGYGWRVALMAMAAGSLLLGAPRCLVFRNRPEDHGLLPDGQPPVASTAAEVPGGHDFGTGLREALRMRAFWYLGLAHLLQIVAIAAFVLHIMPYLTSVGVDRPTAAMVAMAVPLATMPVRFMFGWLGDIIKKKYALALCMFLTGIGLFVFSFIDGGSSSWLVVPFIVLAALGIGGAMPLRAAIIREYFGVQRFGTIYGLAAVFTTVGAIVGAPTAGWVFDVRGVYDPVWLILGVGCLVGAGLMLIMPSPPGALHQVEREVVIPPKPGPAPQELQTYD